MNKIACSRLLVLGGWGEGGEREKKERNVDLKVLPLVSLSLKLEGVSDYGV